MGFPRLVTLLVAAVASATMSAQESAPQAKPTQVAAETPSFDWPNWRGPAQDGISKETKLNWKWPSEGPKKLWQTTIGKGMSSFAVAHGRVYSMGNREDVDTVYCFDAGTGKVIWKHPYPCPLNPLSYEGGPSSTPAVDDDRVYTLSKAGDCFCLDAATGKVIWSRKFDAPPTTKEDYKVWWGFAGSPLIEGNKLILSVGTAGVALNKRTGDILWDNGPGRAGYSSPVPFDFQSERCFAKLSGHEIVMARISDGKILAQTLWRTTWDQNAPNVLVADGKLFVTTGHGVGCALFDIAAEGLTPVWRNKNMSSELASPVLWKNDVYGFDKNRLVCLDWKTGTIRWAAEETRQGSLIVADEKLLVMQEDGTLLGAEATPEAFKPVAKAQVLDGRCWTVPVLSNGRLLLRNAAGTVVCLDLR
jgi:outer membrane protein assembly factor BamB